MIHSPPGSLFAQQPPLLGTWLPAAITDSSPVCPSVHLYAPLWPSSSLPVLPVLAQVNVSASTGLGLAGTHWGTQGWPGAQSRPCGKELLGQWSGQLDCTAVVRGGVVRGARPGRSQCGPGPTEVLEAYPMGNGPTCPVPTVWTVPWAGPEGCC